ncbi:amidohydrolase family protein [Hydrogenophaga sp. BPS33]|uniref:amidohydrolase family protein n=1 Tax=Hydrogenophaga sp. BPS33 TaxID=2651974 RepID=UPI00131F5AAB|nr:amidohydrolase family protein [Hydrogenophaga sp. BPS33]QHE85698.1 amidohydrolase family protein [Hydrogenophaga sp. BPS33]
MPQQPPASFNAIANARLPRWLLASDWPVQGSAPALARIALADGRVARVSPMSALSDAAGTTWDVQGAPVLPGLVDAHTHLDKAFILPRMGAVKPGLLGAIEASIADRANWTREDLRQRAERGLRQAWEAGTTHLRTHVDWWDPHTVPLAWEVINELACEWRGRIRLEQVAMIRLALFQKTDDARALAQCVAVTGAHAVLGGLVHSSNWDPGALRELVLAPQRTDLDLDLHVDEELNADAQGLALVAELLREVGFAGRVVCGHNCALAAMPETRALATLDAVARAPITLVSLPITNLLLQDATTGRTPRLRGLTLVKEARERGIPLLFASDNVQDPFCRAGSLDPLEAMQTAALVGQLDTPFDTWSDALCRGDWLQRQPLERPTLDGARADLVVFTASGAHAWPSRTMPRVVLRDGRPLTP